MRDVGASVSSLATPELRGVTAALLFIWFVAAFVYYGLVQLVANVDFLGGSKKECIEDRMYFPREDLLAILVTAAAEFPGLLFSLVMAQFLRWARPHLQGWFGAWRAGFEASCGRSRATRGRFRRLPHTSTDLRNHLNPNPQSKARLLHPHGVHLRGPHPPDDRPPSARRHDRVPLAQPLLHCKSKGLL